jgi:hypothetical protein
MATFVAKAGLNSVMSGMKNTNIVPSSHNSHIDWNDYNFPPCIKVVHFRLSDFHDNEKKVITKMYVSWILLFSVLSWNIISTIVLSATILPKINILYTFLNLILGMPLGTYVFYCGYFGVAKRESSNITRYKVIGIILLLLMILFSILPFGAINGWARIPIVGDNHSGPGKFGVATCVIESLVYTANYFLLGFTIYQVHNDAVIDI